MFDKLSTEETRIKCRETLDALEFWIRRVIDQILLKSYGPDYFFYKNKDGDFLIKSELRKDIKKRMEINLGNYDKPISATTFPEIIYIVCNPFLYVKHFKSVFALFFPEGVAELRTFLTRLVEPRNKLSHSNPISTREAEQVVCYSHDIIESIKNFYKMENMQEEYNVPTIIQIKDSFGNVVDRRMLNIVGSFDFRENAKNTLHIGDILSVEVEVDPSFEEKEYSIKWTSSVPGFVVLEDKKIEVKIEKKYVTKMFSIECTITSTKDWHAHLYYDDKVQFWYKVLPPN